MDTMELHDDLFMKIFWEERRRIFGIAWKGSPSSIHCFSKTAGVEFFHEIRQP